MKTNNLILLGAAAAALALPSCSPSAGASSSGTPGQYLAAFRNGASPNSDFDQRPLHTRGYWDGDGVSGSSSIRINLAEQKAYFYKGGQLVGMSPIASGTSTHRTPKGRFKVTERDPDHRSSLYGVIKDRATGQVVNSDADTRKDKPAAGQFYEGAPMFHFLRFNGAIGMHEGHLPGYAASHGCVRLPADMAKTFYDHAPLGTPVTVE